MRQVVWTKLSDVAPEPVEWLWEGRIPFGKVTVLDGEPALGKSLVALEIAARVSRGAAMPLTKDRAEPADVALFNDDDSLADTVRPRLEAERADLARVRACHVTITAADFTEFQPKLIIIDPLSAYLCFDRDAPARKVMKDLADVAKETGAAVLVIQHLPKAEVAWADDVYDAARSVLTVTSIGHGRRRLALTKSNLRPAGEVRPLVFQIENANGAGDVTGWSDGV
jgi:RecA-family ATPase